MQILKRVALRATMENDILRHKNAGLRRAIAAKKSSKTRSQALGLTGDPVTRKAQLFTTNQVLAANEF